MKTSLQSIRARLYAILLVGSYGFSQVVYAQSIQTIETPQAELTQQKSRLMQFQNKHSGFQAPTGIAMDQKGNLYIANWSGGTVTKMTPAGEQTIFANGMGSPAGLAFDQNENLYIADYSKNVIYQVSQNGDRKIFASGLKTPTGISFSHSGDLLVANRASNEIAKLDSQGRITIVASGLRTPVGVVEDTHGNL